ncbi:MAG: hypothetical protein IT355_00595 [Gemmatimonadaceae bacterium]|nr:hypothetical protein [Gemmatimonadaceae bacterium]
MTLTRHLLPDELDLLLDGETGFGVQQLSAHLRDCAQCRDELAALRAFVLGLETLPEMTPSLGFADRVMHEVHVFEPWHVAIRTSVAGWVPSSPVARIAAGTAFTSAATLVTGAAAWGWAHRDTTIFVGSLVTERARVGLFESLTATAQALVGPLGATFGSGLPLLGVAGATLLTGAGLGFLGLRAVAARARRLEA